MNAFTTLVSLHLSGEEQNGPPDSLTLDTLPGKFTLTRTDAALTAYGGLVAWSSFLKHLGIIERCAERCPLTRTSPNAAPVREILHSFALSALVEGKRFCHVRWLTDDPAIATIMNMERVRGEDALPRLAKGMSVEQMRDWLQQPQSELYAALPERFIADWDSTVNTRYGHQEDAAVGYNPHKRGRKSHHPLICVAARTRLCLHLEWRPGDTVSATDWQPAMEKLWAHPTIRERLWLNRGDVGFGQEAIMAWHEQEGEKRPKYLFKLRLTSHVRRALAQVPWPLWEGAPTLGCQQLAETTVKLHGWSRERRVVIARTLKPAHPSPQDEFWDTPEDDVAVSVTNLESNEATPEQLALLYAKRADTENVFDEMKNQWGFPRVLQPAGGGDGTGGAAGDVDLQLVESVHAHDGVESGPSQRSGEIAAGLFVPGGTGGGERTATGGETGGESGVVGSVESLLRAAAEVVGGNCAAVGSSGPNAAPARAPNPGRLG